MLSDAFIIIIGSALGTMIGMQVIEWLMARKPITTHKPTQPVVVTQKERPSIFGKTNSKRSPRVNDDRAAWAKENDSLLNR